MIWTKSVIRLARKTELAPLLIDRGYRLCPVKNGNYRILPDPDDPSVPAGLVAKLNFWIWNEKKLSGNTIDFFVKVEGKTFQEAMRIITSLAQVTSNDKKDYDSSERKIPEERENTAKTVR